MKYDPNVEVSTEDLKKLSEAEFFEYIDTKSAYLRQFTAPDLPPYHKKVFKSLNFKQSGVDFCEEATNKVTSSVKI